MKCRANTDGHVSLRWILDTTQLRDGWPAKITLKENKMPYDKYGNKKPKTGKKKAKKWI